MWSILHVGTVLTTILHVGTFTTESSIGNTLLTILAEHDEAHAHEGHDILFLCLGNFIPKFHTRMKVRPHRQRILYFSFISACKYDIFSPKRPANQANASKMPGLNLGDVVPDFDAETSMGPIKFHEWIGDRFRNSILPTLHLCISRFLRLVHPLIISSAAGRCSSATLLITRRSALRSWDPWQSSKMSSRRCA